MTLSFKTKWILTFVLILAIASAAFSFFPRPGDIPVLMYHFIGTAEMAAENKNYVSRETFEKQMAFLHWGGYRVISLADYEAIRNGGRKPKGREVVLTFDDGHVSFLTDALPVLNKYRFPVTLFAVSSQVKEGGADRISESMMRSLLRNDFIDIESHTKTHPPLATLSDEKIREELVDSKKELETVFGRPVPYLAYPLGNIDKRVVREAEKAGYRLAFTTSYKKLNDLPEGPFTIQREKVSQSSDNLFYFWFKLSGIYTAFKRYRHHRYHPHPSL